VNHSEHLTEAERAGAVANGMTLATRLRDGRLGVPVAGRRPDSEGFRSLPRTPRPFRGTLSVR
jgi:hypothetical protein